MVAFAQDMYHDVMHLDLDFSSFNLISFYNFLCSS
jgi:hypothetical protein